MGWDGVGFKMISYQRSMRIQTPTGSTRSSHGAQHTLSSATIHSNHNTFLRHPPANSPYLAIPTTPSHPIPTSTASRLSPTLALYSTSTSSSLVQPLFACTTLWPPHVAPVAQWPRGRTGRRSYIPSSIPRSHPRDRPLAAAFAASCRLPFPSFSG